MNNKGFTLVELMIALLISSIVILGMGWVVVEISKALEIEDIRHDASNYTDNILDMIVVDTIRADIIDVEFGFDGFDGLTLRRKSGDDYTDIRYRFNHATGNIERNDIPIMAHWFHRYGNNKQGFLISRLEFQWAGSYIYGVTASQRVSNSTLMVDMEIELYTMREELIETIHFNRLIFSTKRYLKDGV